MPKSYWWGGWLAHVNLVSALGPNPSFFIFFGLLFNLGVCWDRGLDLNLDHGLIITNFITWNISRLTWTNLRILRSYF